MTRLSGGKPQRRHRPPAHRVPTYSRARSLVVHAPIRLSRGGRAARRARWAAAAVRLRSRPKRPRGRPAGAGPEAALEGAGGAAAAAMTRWRREAGTYFPALTVSPRTGGERGRALAGFSGGRPTPRRLVDRRGRCCWVGGSSRRRHGARSVAAGDRREQRRRPAAVIFRAEPRRTRREGMFGPAKRVGMGGAAPRRPNAGPAWSRPKSTRGRRTQRAFSPFTEVGFSRGRLMLG